MTLAFLLGWAGVLGVATTLGVVAWFQGRRYKSYTVLGPPSPVPRRAGASRGWVYFLSAVGGAWDEPPAPIKVGMTHRNPATDRLPEIERMSPQRLEVLYAIPTQRPELLETMIHKELARFRHHGEWYDRDATLAWLDNWKEHSKR